MHTLSRRLGPQRVKFHTTGSGYFRIWIVHLLLAIVTPGICTAWAKGGAPAGVRMY